MTQVTRIDVWYCSEWTSWGVTSYDAEDNQVGNSLYEYRKTNAVRIARVTAKDLGASLRIYTRDNMKVREE